MKKSDFRLLAADMFEEFKKYSLLSKSVSCERLWSNLQLYMATYQWHCFIENERMWIVSFDASYVFFPMGKEISSGELSEWLKQFSVLHGKAFTLGDVPPDYPDCESVGPWECDPGEADYIYDLEHLQKFSGEKLRKRHNQVRQFERTYEGIYQVAAISEGDLPEILEFSCRLSAAYWDSASGMEEKLAMNLLPENWSDPAWQLAGVQLRVNGQLVGFSIYGTALDGTAVVHFEKADHAYRGCGAKLTAVLVDQLIGCGYCKMNREQDLNNEGLRRAKLALDPEYLYKRKSMFFENK